MLGSHKPMKSLYNPKRIFLVALALLLLSAASGTWMIYRLYATENLVRHTYDVLLSINSVTSDLAKAGRFRLAFLESGNHTFVDEFVSARALVHADIANVRSLVPDNPEQMANCDRLEATANVRLGILQQSIERKQAGLSEPLEEASTTGEVVKASFEAAAIAGHMNSVEEALLEKRSTLTSQLFRIMLAILFVTFSLAILLLFAFYRILWRELQQRSNAEGNAQRLSVLVMTMQDEERRKFARELHDSLGQNLTAAKILADQLIRKLPDEKGLSELQGIVTETLTETRTISHLLHPPLLDEMGFATAARWYMEGYAKRTGIAVSIDMPEEPVRLPRILELTLFRVLQESLTNIHRHSKSKKAEVSYIVASEGLSLRVRDFGVGIPSEKLVAFTAEGSSDGVGLAGMRERVREQGGTLKVSSGAAGTVVQVTFSKPHLAEAAETTTATLPMPLRSSNP
jgi:signal transduction histidine kinase